MNENKYYTPKIEEFYVGFEYEFFNSKNWVIDTDFSTLFNANDTDCLYELRINIEENNIRVKYLDAENIESFGFKGDSYYNEILDISSTREPMMLGSGFSKNNIVIECMCYSPNGYGFSDVCRTYVDQNSYFCISRYNKIERFKVEKTLFSGKVKNKSELRKVLQMIGALTNE